MLNWLRIDRREIKSVVMLDIDGTLLNPSYMSNDFTLKDTITKLEKNGYVFVLNSNRSLEDLLPVASQFNINGILIGENGLFAYNMADKKINYFLDKKELIKLEVAKNKTEKIIHKSLKRVFPHKNIYWQNMDTVSALSKDKPREYKEGSIVALNNKFRKYTVSTHILQYKSGRFIPVKNHLKKIEVLVSELLNDGEITVTSSKDFSSILAYSNKTSKQRTARSINKNSKQAIPILAIGDEVNDYLMVNKIGVFMTVGNAPASVKAKASTISKKRYTKGVNELLVNLAGD